MTIRAYNELYLNDAIKCLANAFDYGINDCGFTPDWFASLFVRSGMAEQFERGNPAIISGKSGEELVRDILQKFYPNEEIPKSIYRAGRTPEYWAGWALAQYQWTTAKRFEDIFNIVRLSEIINMYSVYHEMDITNFIEAIEKRLEEDNAETKLKKIRESRGFSQAELAKESGVKLRSIQLYEQRVQSIDNASAKTVYKLARALGCYVEDLLEKPERL